MLNFFHSIVRLLSGRCISKSQYSSKSGVLWANIKIYWKKKGIWWTFSCGLQPVLLQLEYETKQSLMLAVIAQAFLSKLTLDAN